MAANAYYAVKYLQDRYRMAPHQAAALVGTWQQESGDNLNTGARNKGDGRDGSDSVGIAQWNGDRARGLHSFAADRGTNWTNLDTQIDYAVHELTKGAEKQWGDRLFAAPDVQSAARAAISFERPQGWSPENPSGGHGWDNRFANAQRLLGVSPEEIAKARATSAPMPTGGAPQGLLAMGGGSVLAMPQMASALMGTQVASNDPSFMPNNPAMAAINSALQPQQPAQPMVDSQADPFEGLADDVVEPTAPAAQAQTPVAAPAAPPDPFEGLAEDAAPQGAPIMANPAAQPAKQAPQLDANGEAPAGVRYKVGLLDKPEDRLAALQQVYPDAKAYGEDNFVFTNPETGKLNLYNRESWIPSLGDVASIAPELGEMVGGALGAAGAGVAGAGSGGTGWLAIPAAAGAGATAGREWVQGVGNWLMGNEDTRSVPERLTGQAQTFAANAAGEGAGMAISQGVSDGARALTGRLLRTDATDPVEAAMRAQDMRGIRVEPTAGMVSNTPTTATVEQTLAAYPGSGARIQGRINDAFTGMDTEFQRINNSVRTATNPAAAPTTRQEMGAALREQAEAVKGQFTDRQSQLYDDATNAIGATPAVGTNTQNLMGALTTEVDRLGNHAKLTTKPVLDRVLEHTQSILQDIEAGASFDTLKSSRTAIREMREASTNSTEQRYLGRLYDSLTQDMEATAGAAEDDALQAFRKANNHTRRGYSGETNANLNRAVNPIVNAKTDEDVYRFVMSKSNEGGSRLRAVRQQVLKVEGGQEAWDQLAASVVERIGTRRMGEEGSVFDPSRFLKNWREMPRETKAELFRGARGAQHREDLDRLARITENMKRYRRQDNHSNTAKVGIARQMLEPFTAGRVALGGGAGMYTGNLGVTAAAAGLGLAAQAGNLGTRSYLSRFLTNPDTVNWLAGLPRAEMSRGGIGAHVSKLMDIAVRTGMRAEVSDYLRDSGYAGEADKLRQ